MKSSILFLNSFQGRARTPQHAGTTARKYSHRLATLRALRCTFRLASRTKQVNMIKLCRKLWPAACSGCRLLLIISQVGVTSQLEVIFMAPLWLVCTIWFLSLKKLGRSMPSMTLMKIHTHKERNP